MPLLDAGFAKDFAGHWLDAWNRHDVAAVLAHFSPDFSFSSPLIVQVAGEASGTLRGREAVGAYWTKALGMAPELRFELLGLHLGVDCLALQYLGPRGVAVEVFHFGGDGKAVAATACYAPSRCPSGEG